MISESFQNVVNPNNNVDENTNTDDLASDIMRLHLI